MKKRSFSFKNLLKLLIFILAFFLTLKFVSATNLFEDGFETGNFSNWTSTYSSGGSGSASITVDSSIQYQGSYSAKAEVTDGTTGGAALARKQISWPSGNKLWYTCYVRVSDVSHTYAAMGGIYLLEPYVEGSLYYGRTDLEIAYSGAGCSMGEGQVLSNSTFLLRMAYMGRNGSREDHRQVTNCQAPARETWHKMTMLVDWSGTYPVYAWWLNGKFIWQDTDTSTINNNYDDPPTHFYAGLTNVDWGSGNKGLVWVDNCSISDTGPSPGEDEGGDPTPTPSPTPTSTPSPTPHPTSTPTPTSTPSPTPHPTSTPTPTPTPTTKTTPTPTSTASSSSFSTQTPQSPECTDSPPGAKAPWLYGATPLSSKSILLYFTAADEPVDKYLLEYGLKSNNYQYGAEKTDSLSKEAMTFLIDNLSPNTTYFFRIRGAHGCNGGPWSNEIYAKTKSGLTSFLSSPKISQIEIQPTPKSTSFKKPENNQSPLPKENSETQESSDNQTKSYSLKIEVTDKNNRPLEGAKVYLFEEKRSTITNQQGIAKIENISSGNKKVKISYRGTTTEQILNINDRYQEINAKIAVDYKKTPAFYFFSLIFFLKNLFNKLQN